jgi:hypothetical protein
MKFCPKWIDEGTIEDIPTEANPIADFTEVEFLVETTHGSFRSILTEKSIGVIVRPRNDVFRL